MAGDGLYVEALREEVHTPRRGLVKVEVSYVIRGPDGKGLTEGGYLRTYRTPAEALAALEAMRHDP